jgi:predicted porin
LEKTEMKKTLVALAAFVTVGAAFAQSSVTLYGRIDASIASQQTKLGSVTTADKGIQVRAGAHTGNRWGLKGSEDLGGGLKANFQLEQGFSVDDGEASSTKQFHRVAKVGLSGGFGSLDVGRQYSPIDNLYGQHDAFGYSGYGAMNYAFNAGGYADSGRINNSVFYMTPNMGGFSGGIMWAPGENKVPGVTSAGRLVGLQAIYGNGPLNIGGAYESAKATGGAPTTTAWDLGASYDIGAAKLFGQLEGAKNKSAAVGAASKDQGFQIGAVIPLGAPSLMVSYARENTDNSAGVKVSTASAFSLMAQYPLSKRTYVYAAYLRGTTDPTAAGVATSKQQNYGLGLVHNF